MKHRILVTAPSLSIKTNVSGISALVRPLVNNFPDVFFHLYVGTPDGRKGILNRVLYLFKALGGLVSFSFSGGSKRFHLNTAADTPSLCRDVVLLILARILLLRVVVHFHGGKWITTPGCPKFARVLVRALCNGGQACVVLGLDEATVLREKFGVTRSITVLPNYVSPEFICEPNVADKEPLSMLFLGRLVESKTVDKLAELLRKVLDHVPDARLIVCGDGPLRERLLGDLASLPEKSWIYRGVVSGAAKLDVLRKADVYILPSVTGEGMPIAMLEAMACGAIPVVTRLGAIPSVIRHGENGFIADPGDIDGFVECSIKALTADFREILRVCSFETSLSFSIEAYRQRLDAIYSL